MVDYDSSGGSGDRGTRLGATSVFSPSRMEAAAAAGKVEGASEEIGFGDCSIWANNLP